MKQKIIVAGSSNTDMVVKVPHIPAPGETILGTGFMTISGGKGANQAVAAARAGAGVTFIACVSDDPFGMQSIDNYKKDGIDTSRIKIKPGTHSGIALINVAEDGENSISVAPGANSDLLPDDILACEDVFTDTRIVLAQLEIPLKTVMAVAKSAHSKGIPFILNPAPGRAIPEELLKMTTVITPNESEAAIITGRDQFTEQDIPAMARELFEKGVQLVILTLGSKGVYMKSEEYEGLLPGFAVKAVDTTAAGDVFNGALAAALAGEMPVRKAIDFAQRAAAISVTRMGAQPSAPSLQEIREYVF
jgi:ribokinase